MLFGGGVWGSLGMKKRCGALVLTLTLCVVGCATPPKAPGRPAGGAEPRPGTSGKLPPKTPPEPVPGKAVSPEVAVQPTVPPGSSEAFTTGRAALEAGNLDEAVRQLREAVVQQPRNAEAYYYLGRAYHAKRMSVQAARAYRSAIRLDGDYMWPHYDLGRLLSDEKQYDDAVMELRHAIKLRSNYAWSHVFLGRCLSAKGDAAGAVRAYERALEYEPADAYILRTLAEAYAAGGDKDRAIGTYRRLIQVSGDDQAQVDAANDAIAKLKGESKPPPQDPVGNNPPDAPP
ncbi:MAG: hypothetical protein AMS16_03930 [Planctomycetes bacterium DG_58]|nr:MAG: hypothetical protein AMS16_03930 [Planctomycetes bacterium DG_58]